MNHTGIDKVTYGVSDLDAGTKFWTDFGLSPTDTSAKGAGEPRAKGP